MMKILYGIQGTGNGHITRARHMASSFAKRDDIQVDYLFSGRTDTSFFDMQAFPSYKTNRGLTFDTKNGQLSYIKTLLKNNLCHFVKEVSDVNITQYDLLINDFEPVTGWAAKKAGVPSLSISHQAAYLHHVPKYNQGFLDKLITQHFAPTKYSIGTHWYHFGHPIIPPVVAADLIESSNKHLTSDAFNSHIVVYLPFESLSQIRHQLHVLSDWIFVCYHPMIDAKVIDRNIVWQPLSSHNFQHDLVKCSGVISNSGFELATECLSIGKPLLVKPLQKQYEQLSNAYTLEQLGLCEVLANLDAEDIDDWLQSKHGVKVDFPTDCDDLVDWIAQANWETTEQICRQMWQQVSFPNQVQGKLDTLTRIVN